MRSAILAVIKYVYTVIVVIAVIAIAMRLHSFWGFVITLISGAASLLPWYVMSSMSNDIDVMQNELYQTRKATERLRSDLERKDENSAEYIQTSNSKLNLSQIASCGDKTSWRCPSCGKTNPNSSRVCKDCGYQK